MSEFKYEPLLRGQRSMFGWIVHDLIIGFIITRIARKQLQRRFNG